jgi:hypothetical protein
VSASSRNLDGVEVTFDDPNLVANAGLVLVGSLVVRLGLERLINDTVRLVGRVGGSRPGRKLLTLVHALIVGGDHIDHVEVLRAGSTAAVLPHKVMAPSTIGTFLRAFTFGHLRQLDKVLGEALGRAWAMGAGPGDEELVVDIDSTITEVHGHHKQGATFGYTGQRGYHPILATRADTGEILHARQRKGSANTARGTKRFVEELVARLRRAGATATIIVRADSGYWSNKTIETLERLGVGFSIAVRCGNKAIRRAIEDIDEAVWRDIVYPDGGRAQVADTRYKGRRLVVRRTRLVGEQAQLWPDWRHHAFVTDRAGDVVDVDAFHRAHATVELAIRDLKASAGANHMPSGHFAANGAWLAAAVLAHNLIRWTSQLGNIGPPDRLVVARTILVRLLAIPARLVNRAGRLRLRMPTRWPWAHTFTTALDTIRAIPAAPS